MIKIKNLAARTLTSLMVATTLSVTMPFSTVFAAPATDYVYFAAADTADEEVETVIKAIETYKRTGNKSDLDKVNALISKLSSKKLIKLYVYLSKDLYLKNYLTKGFLYFDVDKYLANNADVRISASLHKITDIRKYALEHYLTLGIYEGRKSETSFDPARAVLNSPELLTHFIQGQKEKPTEADLPLFVRQEYGEKTGKTTTADLDENGQVKTVTPHNDPAPTQNSNSNAGSSEGSGQGDEEGQKEPEKPEDKYRTPVFRNNDSNIITPYTLYDFEKKNKNFDFTIEDRPNYPRGYNDVTVMFFGENVELAQKLAGQRKFTLMQYMCGTDLEGESRAVSNEISTMLQAGSSDNMNILIFLGGTKDYGASYLNDDLSGLRAGIYYLNMAGLSKEVKEKLRAIPFIENTAEVTKILEGKAQDKENICKGLKYEDIINDQTLIQLAAISEIDMTDPSLLAGFINFGTELFPADRYGLTLNNHGGGYEGGIISTEQLEKDGSIEINKSNISADKLESALASTLLFRDKSMSDDGKFSFIYYDACLMGAVEQAYNMRDYSKFMIGAEEVGLGTSDYRFAIENVNKLLGEDGTDRAIAIEIAKAYIDESLHTGTKDGMIGSAAVFSTDAIDDTFTKINTLARDFSYVLGDNICSDTFRNDIFKAIRLAAFSSYKTGNAGEGGTDFKEMFTDIRSIDIGDFYNYLKINMMGVENSAETYSAQDKEVLGRINRELDDVLDAGFLVYLNTKTFEDFGAVTKTDYEGIIPLNYAVDTKKDVWSDVRGKDSGIRVFPYGASMVFSYGENGDAFKTQYLYHAVKGKGMEDYANFLVDFLKFNEDPEGYEKQKQALAKEMMDKNLYTKLITQEEGNNGYTTTLTDENNKTYTYVSFKIADSYEAAGLTAPENSTGSPMLDIMDTQDGIWLTGVHKEYFDYKDSKEGDGRLSVDMICAEKRIKHYSIAPGSNTVYFDVSQTTSSITEAFALLARNMT
ncbi:MAG: hypothetical protein IJU77_01535 [Butyrivibrio sp.]|nr:hypothetical protein [Butyrivibrio sp.]